MASFESGVKAYVKARAVVEVNFPIDWKDNAEIACKHCPYLVRSKQICGLNSGHECPLIQVEVTENV